MKTPWLIIVFSCLLTACAGQSIHVPGQVGVIEVDGVPVGISRGVADLIEKEDLVDTNDERVRCEQTERTGTHRILRLCRTLAEIEDEARRTRDELDRLHRRGHSRGASGL